MLGPLNLPGLTVTTAELERIVERRRKETKASKRTKKPEVAPDRKPAPTPRAEGINIDAVHKVVEQATVPPVPPDVPAEPQPGTAAWLDQLPAPADQAPARWGIFSDGELHIEKNGTKIVFERVEFESLLAFLNRTCGEASA